MQTQTTDSTSPAVLDAPVQETLNEPPCEEAPACSSSTVILENLPSQSVYSSHAARTRWASRVPSALLFLGAGYLAAKILRAFGRQQRELLEACRHLRSAQDRLVAKEQTLEQTEARCKTEQEAHIAELGQQMADAQRELATMREMCQQAAAKLEQGMSDLSVTESELRAARAQLHNASRDLAITHAQLEATEGELGLTRSQNELMKREVDLLRRQLREASQQLEGYIMVSRGRKNAAAAVHHDDYCYDDTRMGRADLEDDLTAEGTAGWGY